MNSRFERHTHLDERDGAQVLACLDFIQEAVECSTRRAIAANDWETVGLLEHAARSLTTARKVIVDVNPHAWHHLRRARREQRDIDQQRAARTPIDNMGVPDEQRGENGS